MKYLETIYQRYRKSSKESKGKILDDLIRAIDAAVLSVIYKSLDVRGQKLRAICAEHKKEIPIAL